MTSPLWTLVHYHDQLGIVHPCYPKPINWTAISEHPTKEAAEAAAADWQDSMDLMASMGW